MKFLADLIIVVVAMGLKDIIYTALTIYESRGEARTAGILDALGDAVSMIYMVVGVDALTNLGISVKGAIILGAIMITSYNTTMRATRWVTKHENQ